MRIGIIGAENSHAASVAKVINVEQRFPGVRVECLWGETEADARKTAEAGQIPTIVDSPREMLGRVDAIMVDHRHGKHHLRAARPFVERGLPAFIDKPFCFCAAEGREFLKLARQHGAPITSFSTMTLQKSFLRFRREQLAAGEARGGATWGPCDVRSPYGGVFFYGVHHVEMALDAFGDQVAAVRLTPSGTNAIAQLLYPSGCEVTLHFYAPGCGFFQIAAVTGKGLVTRQLVSDASPYYAGVKRMIQMFRSGIEPASHERLLKPVQILEALARSLKSGRAETLRV